MLDPTKAVVLLSGGLDSMVCAALAREAGCSVIALTVDYNQRHRCELEAAARIVAALGLTEHIVAPLNLRSFGGSALTSDTAVPKHGLLPGIPVTYVPARNTIFLSLALGLAEARAAKHIYVGVNALDYSGYPDCRPEFIDAFATMAALATRRGSEGRPIAIAAPLGRMAKHEIISLGVAHGVDYADTVSCYDPMARAEGVTACGRCDSCRLRRSGFARAGVPDPTRYGD